MIAVILSASSGENSGSCVDSTSVDILTLSENMLTFIQFVCAFQIMSSFSVNDVNKDVTYSTLVVAY